MKQYAERPLGLVGCHRILGIHDTEDMTYTAAYIQAEDYLYQPLTAFELIALGQLCITLGEAMSKGLLKFPTR